MTNSIDQHGNTVPAHSHNLVADNEMRSTSRDATEERAQQGYYSKHTNWISDEEMEANPNAVIRNGSRIHIDGNHQPGDVVLVEGMEVEYATAVSLGPIENPGERIVSPHDDFAADSENTDETDDGPLTGAELLSAQLDMATDGRGDEALDVFATDIVINGEISEKGIEFAARQLGMNEQVVQEQFEAMQMLGGENLEDALEVGDGLGADRVQFLVDRAEHGSPAEQQLVRQIWTAAALGKMSKGELQRHFDKVYKPYE